MKLTILLTLATAIVASPVRSSKEEDPDWLPEGQDPSSQSPETTSGVITEQSLGLNAEEWFDKYGYPGPILKESLLHKDAYISAPNFYTKNPYWGIEHISADSIKIEPGVSRDKSQFEEEKLVPEYFRSTLDDYKRSGYDRGHQVPAGNVQFAQNALDQTFLLSNMCPQVGKGFNRNYWAWTEEFGRNMTGSYDTVRIMTGPLYLPTSNSEGTYSISYPVIGEGHVHVPTHFFKVVIGENRNATSVDAAAFVMPNEPIDNSVPLTNWQRDFANLTAISGLKVLQEVKDMEINDLCEAQKCEIHIYSHDRYNPA